MKQRWVQGGLLLAVLLLAFGLRFHKLEAQSFWNDEGNSARLSERAIPLIIEGTASDIHPPFYYLILRGWRELVGETEFGLRSFSAFVGVGTVAVTLALGKELITKEQKRERGKGKRVCWCVGSWCGNGRFPRTRLLQPGNPHVRPAGPGSRPINLAAVTPDPQTISHAIPLAISY